jgi:broad specificity phosphatase PhoE
MAYVLLVRHSLPEIAADRPARQWRLNAEGRQRCRPLAEKLAAYGPAQVITSQEPKAQETGRLLAEGLGLAWETAAGLHEHERDGVPFLEQAEWERQVADFFARPNELVLGSETAIQAGERFAAALQRVLDRFPGQTVVIVSHGTVMSLLAADRTGIDPLPFWRSLAMPDLVILQRPELILAVGPQYSSK